MKSFPIPPQTPERRGVTDPRSTPAPATGQPARKPLLNDRRSTR